MSAAPTATQIILDSTAVPVGPSSPFSNSNSGSEWSVLTIASILVTVMGFVAVIFFVFWIFRKEKLAREEVRREADANFWPGFPSAQRMEQRQQPTGNSHRYYC